MENKQILRDAIKEITGPDTIFIILRLDAELQRKRLQKRSRDPRDVTWTKEYKYFDILATIDEPNVFVINITGTTTFYIE